MSQMSSLSVCVCVCVCVCVYVCVLMFMFILSLPFAFIQVATFSPNAAVGRPGQTVNIPVSAPPVWMYAWICTCMQFCTF